MYSHVIPATDTAPAVRAYACGCTYRADGGWSHCHSHTTVKGTLAVASKVSQAAARDVARRARAAARIEVRQCHGGTMTLYHYEEDRP